MALAKDEVAFAPPYALYSLRQIRWMGIVGGPLAATLMMSDNFKKLGLARRAKWTWYIGGSVVLGVVALSILAEQRLGSLGTLSLGIPLAIGASEIARQTQGSALDNHRNNGGRAQPLWKALLVLVGSLVLLVVGTPQLMAMLSTTVNLKGGHQVSIEGYATKDDAIRVGAVLAEVGVLRSSQPVTFVLGRNRKNWVVEFTVIGDAARDEQTLSGFEDVARTLRERAFGGAPVELNLTNRLGIVDKTIVVDGEGHINRR